MRTTASILHLDLDAFFAAVEQRDKPSLRGKPVIVGGTGGRGVVSTASYEARRYGVGSAMSGREARARCPHAAFLSGRFHAYRDTSRKVMQVLRDLSPLVEPLSLDEAFVDLTAAGLPDLEVATVTAAGEELRRRVQEVTGGLTATVGIASSKFLAKVASELEKPDGMTVVPPGTELELLRPMRVTVIPGVGPATTERLRRAGIHTIAELELVPEDELVRLLGQAHGHGLWQLARAQDPRPVLAERETKSISAEGTYDTDLTDRRLMEGLLTRQAKEVGARMRKSGYSGRTVTIKVRLYDFTTLSRSSTLSSPTDDGGTIGRIARSLLADLDTTGGVRLLGVGVSGLADWVQEDLFGETDEEDDAEEVTLPEPPRRAWPPGADVVHDEMGAGWVWGSGSGVVTVRFETADTPPGPVRSFKVDDPALRRFEPPAED
ncbi:DNA polymerase IV [Nocardioides hwasunensis]|uniref:DNA polymerase IV n=1 Tax=Nocardioides hwasunensis TaxID=397258 RepID=A0ABR8MER2_9ACTN|nr:DNA polymerase IV [Nocardioides hwasunensis]MBD3914591.1 DNA polymerase IV [Nocardioides hwasunensis]